MTWVTEKMLHLDFEIFNVFLLGPCELDDNEIVVALHLARNCLQVRKTGRQSSLSADALRGGGDVPASVACWGYHVPFVVSLAVAGRCG